MSITRVVVLLAAVLLGACTTHRAVRVPCDTRLQPINVPVPVAETSSPPNHRPSASLIRAPAGEERGRGEESAVKTPRLLEDVSAKPGSNSP